MYVMTYDNPNRKPISSAKPHPQPPYQASAWSYKYNGRWMGKTEHSPTGLRKNFGRLDSWKETLAKVVDLVSLRALFGPGAPDPDLARFQIHYKWKFIDFPLVLLTF